MMVIFIVWIVLFRLEQKSKLESPIKVCTNKNFCNVLVPSEDTKILEFNQYCESDETPFIIYDDIKSLMRKNDECKNNPEKSST